MPAEELLAAGYTNVRRYQLGIPVWRALGGITEIEAEGVQYVREQDQTAVWIDARDPEEFAANPIPHARNLPLSGVKPGKDVGEVKKAKDDGRLPMEDHNTRIIVFGRDGAQAKAVADTDRAGEDGQRRQVDPGGRQHDDDRQTDEEDTHQLAGERPHRRRGKPSITWPTLRGRWRGCRQRPCGSRRAHRRG